MQTGAAVAAQPAAILCGGSNSASAVRADQFDTPFGKTRSEPIAVGSAAVDQSSRNGRGQRRVDQRLDQIDFGMIGCGDVDCQGEAAAVGKHHDLGALAATRLTNVVTPFFAEANVPSADDSSQSILP